MSLDETVREKIMRLLKDSPRPLSAREIIAELGLDPRGGEEVVYEHLRHIAKSVWRTSRGREAVYMVPPRCLKCGYVFKDLREPRKPSRCPRCKSQWIEPPKFKIMKYE